MTAIELYKIVIRRTKGRWHVWTSNSNRRITAHNPDGSYQQDGGVLSAVTHRGVPDLAGNNLTADLETITTLVNHSEELADLVFAVERWSLSRFAPRGDKQAEADEQYVLTALARIHAVRDK